MKILKKQWCSLIWESHVSRSKWSPCMRQECIDSLIWMRKDRYGRKKKIQYHIHVSTIMIRDATPEIQRKTEVWNECLAGANFSCVLSEEKVRERNSNGDKAKICNPIVFWSKSSAPLLSYVNLRFALNVEPPRPPVGQLVGLSAYQIVEPFASGLSSLSAYCIRPFISGLYFMFCCQTNVCLE